MLQPAFAQVLQRPAPLLLDGGLATQLEAQGCDLGGVLWSARLLLDDEEAIVAAHRAYIEAGAECVATASYQASREGFAQLGIDGARADELMLGSVELARQAAASSTLVAASLGPYGAMLNDGSEYRGDYGVDADVLRDFHQKRLRLFDAGGADVLALETIPSALEAAVLDELLRDCETPAWISFSCRDEAHICDGTPLADVAALFADHPTVLAVGINCTPPQYAPALVRTLRRAVPGKAAMAYPNSGETYNPEDGSWSGTVTPLDCAQAADAWVAAGATVVGGCCRMGPAHIRAMRDALRR